MDKKYITIRFFIKYGHIDSKLKTLSWTVTKDTDTKETSIAVTMVLTDEEYKENVCGSTFAQDAEAIFFDDLDRAHKVKFFDLDLVSAKDSVLQFTCENYTIKELESNLDSIFIDDRVKNVKIYNYCKDDKDGS